MKYGHFAGCSGGNLCVNEIPAPIESVAANVQFPCRVRKIRKVDKLLLEGEPAEIKQGPPSQKRGATSVHTHHAGTERRSTDNAGQEQSARGFVISHDRR